MGGGDDVEAGLRGDRFLLGWFFLSRLPRRVALSVDPLGREQRPVVRLQALPAFRDLRAALVQVRDAPPVGVDAVVPLVEEVHEQHRAERVEPALVLRDEQRVSKRGKRSNGASVTKRTWRMKPPLRSEVPFEMGSWVVALSHSSGWCRPALFSRR